VTTCNLEVGGTMTTLDRYIIRTSDKGMFKRCRQQWDFGSKIRQNYEPKRLRHALDFGTAVHAGLEAYYNPDTWHMPESVKQASAVSHFAGAWGEYKVYATDDVQLADWHADLELGMAMICDYIKEYAKDNWKPVKVEAEFEVPVIVPRGHSDIRHSFRFEVQNGNELMMWNREANDYLPVVYQGRIDLIIEDEQGHYWIVDHKTAKKFDSVEWLALDDQCGSYAWALQRMLGVTVRGVVYNELRKDAAHYPKVLKNGSLSKDKSQNTTLEMYVYAIKNQGLDPLDYRDILEYLGQQGNKFFRRTMVARSPHELENLEERIFLETVEMLSEPVIYPTPGKFTCTNCEFFQPCLAKQDGSDYAWLLNDQYRKRD
jgi:hypothetical protein